MQNLFRSLLAVQYIYTSIDFPGATVSMSYGINNSGIIVGKYETPITHRYSYDGTSFSTIDPPGAVSGNLRDINDSGTVVGQYKDTKSHGYLHDGTNYTTLDVPGSLWTKGTGINNSGHSVGCYGDDTGEHGYLHDGTNYTTLDVPGSLWTWADGINDSGLIVGVYENGPNNMHGFLFDGISYTTIDFPGAEKTHLYDINNEEFIIGSYYDGADTHGFLFDGHSYITIDYPDVSYSRAVGINNFGQIVGDFHDSDGIIHGFIANPASASSLATDVGGIINTDTTWTLANSPYMIISNVQVAENVTLTIEPGVIITTPEYDGGSGTDGEIILWGILNAVGTEVANITFNGIHIRTDTHSDGIASLTLQYVQFNGGNLSSSNYKSLILRDSIFWNAGISCGNTKEDCIIERNIFIRLAISVHTSNIDSQMVYIRNNSFYDQIYNSRAIFLFNLSKIIIEYNSFWNTDRRAIDMNNVGSGTTECIAINNFWNTTDTNVIDSMIYDRNDSLELMGYIIYEPFLTESHPNTPTYELPIAEAGPFQTVYAGEQVTLDGSQSYDFQSAITSFHWVQMEGSTVNLSNVNSVNPIFITPSVDIETTLIFQLTVRDNDNLQDTDLVNITITPSPLGTPPTITDVELYKADNLYSLTTSFKIGDEVISAIIITEPDLDCSKMTISFFYPPDSKTPYYDPSILSLPSQSDTNSIFYNPDPIVIVGPAGKWLYEFQVEDSKGNKSNVFKVNVTVLESGSEGEVGGNGGSSDVSIQSPPQKKI